MAGVRASESDGDPEVQGARTAYPGHFTHEHRIYDRDLLAMDHPTFQITSMALAALPQRWTFGMFGLNLNPAPKDGDRIEWWYDPLESVRVIRWG